jgi:phospholipid/cholesterol/gamma-HCH transport system substrate-binding protein
MYASRTTQLIIGVFALIGIAALVYLSVSLGRIQLFAGAGYTLYANFDNITGLKSGDEVQIAGVTVGKVTAISLDTRDYRAHVAMNVQNGIEVDKDAIASIKTQGIIGNKYVSIAPGPGEEMLKNGGVIRQTQSAFVLEDAIGQLINSSGSGASSSGQSSSLPSIGGQSGVSGAPGNCNCGGQNKK